jgi:AcrR family transcriptional regulator
MTTKKRAACKRPYSTALRLELSDRKRAAILTAARAQLESHGFSNFTFDTLARQAGVTRQTVHNLFGTKRQLLEAVFDQLAVAGGMTRMREVMQQSDPVKMLSGFLEVFCEFWAKDRMLTRRIHGFAAIDPEFGAAIEARNLRRKGAAARIVERMSQTGGGGGGGSATDKARRSAILYALTSFEFFDALADACGSTDAAALAVKEQVQGSLALRP